MLYVNYLFFFFFFFGHAIYQVGTEFINQRRNSYPLQWKHGVLITGPPGKSSYVLIKLETRTNIEEIKYHNESKKNHLSSENS